MKYTEKKRKLDRIKRELADKSMLPAVTSDGHKVSVYANIGSAEEAEALATFHVKGVGLLRSEFLYMENTHFPTEEEQFEAYKAVAYQLELPSGHWISGVIKPYLILNLSMRKILIWAGGLFVFLWKKRTCSKHSFGRFCGQVYSDRYELCFP
jgi:hypothetical protein